MGVVEHWGADRRADRDLLAGLDARTGCRPSTARSCACGAYEVLFSTDVPEPVAISEGVGLATELSTDDSPRFVNGLLARLAEVKPTLA